VGQQTGKTLAPETRIEKCAGAVGGSGSGPRLGRSKSGVIPKRVGDAGAGGAGPTIVTGDVMIICR
jgi:hypothetical protein